MIVLLCTGPKPSNTAGRSRKGLAGGFWVLLACCLVIAPGAYGHVLQGPHVIELMAGTLSGGHALQVRQLVWVAEGAGAAQVEYAETLDYLFPGRFRSDARYEQTSRILVSNHHRTVTVIDGTMISERENRFEAYKDLLLHQPRNTLARNLIRWGVDIATTSLGLWEENVVYVIGARYPDESSSQVWVEKERLLPVRWIIRQPHPSQTGHSQYVVFVYQKWRQHGETWYPMLIDTYLDGRMIRQSRVTQIEVNTARADQLFDIDHLIAISKRTEAPPPDVHKFDELQRTIDDFKKKFQP
jgi:hypothetical protein